MRRKIVLIIIFVISIMLLVKFLLKTVSLKQAEVSKVNKSETIQENKILRDINNVNFAKYNDKNALLFFYWTTWCPFCRTELKRLNDTYADLTRDGVIVLPINVGEQENPVEKFITSQGIEYKIFLDKDGNFTSQQEIIGVPTFILKDKSGKVVFNNHYFPKNFKELLTNK